MSYEGNNQQGPYNGQQEGQGNSDGWGARGHDHGGSGNGGYQQNRGGGGYGGGQGGGGYQPRQGGYQGGGGGGGQGGFQRGNFQKGGGGGFNKGGFQRKEDPPSDELYMTYVGTGNDNPPPHVIDQINQIAKDLETRGYTLRTGGMKGCEDVFEKAVAARVEVHLPWRNFDNKDSKFTWTPENAKLIAARFQPGYEGLKPVIQTFLAKNVRMIMGDKLKSPALFMVTWSEDGAETAREKTIKTGNAGHAILVAAELKIPVFNLGKQGAMERLFAYLDQNKPREQVQQQQSHQPPQQDHSSDY